MRQRTMRAGAHVLVLVVLMACATRVSRAQTGLVLGGGGARGLAHAGVLAGAERLGYAPDVVVGTSMGAIVGALYAAGYDAETIWTIVAETNWLEMFAPAPVLVGPDRATRYPVIRIGAAIREREFVQGFIPDWRINRTLVRLLFEAQARARGDFDRLPRRFRAVTASLRTGQEVVLASGDLARAVRASMAVPGVFAPVVWQDEVLVDGGVANYLPVSVARTMGADTVIAVDVIRPPAELEDVGPVPAGVRAFRLLLINAGPDVSPDILLVPPIDPGWSSARFPTDVSPLLRAGLRAALDELPPAPPTARRAPRRLPPPPDSLRALVVEAPSPALAALVRRTFAGIVPGPFDASAVLAATDRLYATGLFDGVWPRVVHETGAEGSPALVVRVTALPPTAFDGALGYDNDRGLRGWARFRFRTRVGGRPAEVGITGSATELEQWGALSGRLSSLIRPPLAWSGGVYYRETDVRLFADNELLGDLDVRRAGAWLGLEYRRIAPERMAVAVIRAEQVDTDLGEDGVSVGPLLRFGEIEPVAPIVGGPDRIEAELRWGEVAYQRLHVRGSLETERERVLLAAVADVAVTDRDAPLDVRPALGDVHAMPGFRWGRERGQARVLAGVDAAHPIVYDGYARLRLRAGAAPDALDEMTERAAWVAGAEFGVLWPTPFGIVSLSAGANTRNDWRIDLTLGPMF